MLALRLALPALPTDGAADMRAELRVLVRGPVLLALALTTIGFGGVFTVFTYIAPILRDETHLGTGAITVMLMLFGVGATIGNTLGGRFADRSADRALTIMLVVLTLTLVVFAVLMRWPVAAALAILVWGVASFAIVPPLQMRVMAAAAEAPNLASAMNIGAFNLGNAIGAALGGGVIGAHFGLPAVSLAGAAMAAAALVLLRAVRRPVHTECSLA